MRIVNRQEFLELPIGTVYSFYESLGNIEELHIKHGSLANDWYYQDLISSVDCKDSGEFVDIMMKAEKGNTEFHNDLNCLERDGLFEKDQRFVIYDMDDVQRLVNALTDMLELLRLRGE